MFLSKKVLLSKLLIDLYFINYTFFYRQIGHNLVVPGGTKTIDVTGKLVMPGKNDIKKFLFEINFIF
jgi:hypothetical protein